MIKHFDDVLSESDIAWFKQDFESRIAEEQYDVREPWDTQRIKTLYGIDNCQALEYRVILNDQQDPARQRLNMLLADIIPEHIWFYAAYQRQFIPQNLHVDDFLDPYDPEWCMTGIMPLDDNPRQRHKTIVWQQEAVTTDVLFDLLKSQSSTASSHGTAISDSHDIEHVLSICDRVDHMPLLATYNYQPGTLFLFSRLHMHASSNWRKYQDESFKDFILLHLG